MIITIDGGSASGKTTLARTVSERFEIPLLESGSLYRTLTARALQAGISIEDPEKLKKYLDSLSLQMKLHGKRWQLLVNGTAEAPEALRDLEVTRQVAGLARFDFVRSRLLSLQRSCYSKKLNGFLVAEGRDMGTRVFPKAEAKIFLTVSQGERNKRRKSDFDSLGAHLSEEKVGQFETERDRMDRERDLSPLKTPPGAFVLDTTGKTVQENYEKALCYINRNKETDNWVYSIVRMLVFLPRFHLNSKWKGREFLPSQGGFIVASNHLSNLDPVLLGFASNRTLTFLARSTLFQKNPLFVWLIRSLNAFPINRENPEKKTFIEILHLLLKGHGIVYFPEGTRSRTGGLGRFKKGIGILALRTQFPVIPAVVKGTREAMPPGSSRINRSSVAIAFGPAVHLCDLYSEEPSTEAVQEATRRVREAVIQLQN